MTTDNAAALLVGSTTGGPTSILRGGDPAPGTAAGVLFSAFGNPELADDGSLVFSATLTGTGVSTANDTALFVYDPAGGGRLVVREGDVVDVGGGTLRAVAAGGIFAPFSDLDSTATALAGDGRLAMRLTFTDGTTGVFVAAVPEPGAAGIAGVAAAVGLLRRQRTCPAS